MYNVVVIRIKVTTNFHCIMQASVWQAKLVLGLGVFQHDDDVSLPFFFLIYLRHWT